MMPGLDGTGPMGMGPMTGGARGWCNPYGPMYNPWGYPRWGAGPMAYGAPYGYGAWGYPGWGAGMPYGYGWGFRPGMGMAWGRGRAPVGYGRGMAWGRGMGRGRGFGMGYGMWW